MKCLCTLTIFLLATLFATAQTDVKPKPLSISGFAELYYAFDFNEPDDHNRPSFIYSHHRHNEVNLNLGFLKAAYTSSHVRGTLALMSGTYANANLAAEPGVLKNIFEANGGVKISKTRELWVDAGIMPSHIGFESAISRDCWTLTRSILAENTPYYEAGARLSYTSNSGKWYLAGMYLNGWQRIQRVGGNSTPSFGTQITFKPVASVTLNSSTFIGTDKPDTVTQMRYYHNLYGIFNITEAFGATVGFDYGIEQVAKDSSDYNVVMSPVLILRYAFVNRFAFAVRGECYFDKNGVIIATGTPNGFQTIGVSANFDFYVRPNALWRIEARGFKSKDPIFVKNNYLLDHNSFLTTSLAITY